MAITSHDVARLAGVSQPTVSRALRDQPGVSQATRARVRQAAKTLGYIASETGRALATRQASKIGVVSSELTNPFYAALPGLLAEAFAMHGYRTIFITDRGDQPLAIEPLLDGSLDGVALTTSAVDSKLPEELRHRGMPCVLIHRTVDGADCDVCCVDTLRVGADTADLLISLGHRRIGTLLGPAETSTGRDCGLGFIRRLASAGIACDPALQLRGPFAAETGRVGLRRLMGAARPPTAIYCGNDVIALGALNEAFVQGVRVPQELTLVGFGDIPMSSWPMLDLTTTKVDLGAMADVAARLLVSQIADPSRPAQSVVLRASMVLRGTHDVAFGGDLGTQGLSPDGVRRPTPTLDTEAPVVG
ncbi:MAG: LacI family transcriptional regulator [Actinomycetota bacterium]|nr:LacI family transcriptional regulator [Actinomycetota bacterium]